MNSNAKKMIKVSDVKEAVIIRDALSLMLIMLQAQKDLYKDKKLYDETINAVNSLRIKFDKIASTRMRINDKGQFEFLNVN